MNAVRPHQALAGSVIVLRSSARFCVTPRRQRRRMAKDGQPLMPGQPAAAPARQTIAVGETYDFEYHAPAGRKTLWLEVRTPTGSCRRRVT